MKPLFGGFFPMAVYCTDGAILSSAVFALAMMHRAEGCNPLFGGFFAYGGDASRRNEVFVMRLFCVGFCKIGK